MTYLIQFFGILMMLAGIAILVDPNIVFGPMRRHKEAMGMQMLAVAVRTMLGALLVAYSAQAKFPVLVTVLGCFTLVAALLLALTEGRAFIRLISWSLGLTRSFGRAAGVFVAFFGLFLVYVFF